MDYAIEMGSGALIYIPSFKKIGSAIQKIGGNTYTDTQTHTHTYAGRKVIS
jgi:hypothetical protein